MSFESSDVEERQQLFELVPSRLRVDGKEIWYNTVKLFGSILVSANSQSLLARCYGFGLFRSKCFLR